MRIIIAVAAHKQAWMPQDPVYLPMQAGAANHAPLGFLRDDAGENISEKNDTYCELTVLYHLWRHGDADVLGLAHYRRHFAIKRMGGKRERILTGDQLEKLLAHADVIVPRPRIYLIETNESHYIHAHGEAGVRAVRAEIKAHYPEYEAAFKRVMKRRWGRRFNMCIMKRAQFNAYCTWLFGVLRGVEECITPRPREMGYLAERLMDVWLERNRPRMRSIPVVHLEGENWPKKIAGFLRRKYEKK